MEELKKIKDFSDEELFELSQKVTEQAMLSAGIDSARWNILDNLLTEIKEETSNRRKNQLSYEETYAEFGIKQ